MACACNAKKGQQIYTVTASNGQKSSYRTEIEAASAAARLGGTYKKAS